ncbi:25290_t:CDS:1, partial [Dentiscutata erythropus]
FYDTLLRDDKDETKPAKTTLVKPQVFLMKGKPKSEITKGKIC